LTTRGDLEETPKFIPDGKETKVPNKERHGRKDGKNQHKSNGL